MSDDDIDDIIALADESGNGEIDYNEFLHMVLSDDHSMHAPLTPPPTSPPASAVLAQTEL